MFGNIQWKVLLDQLHNMVIASGAIVGALGFSTVLANNIVGIIGTAIAVVSSVMSASNVNAAINQPPSAGAGNATSAN